MARSRRALAFMRRCLALVLTVLVLPMLAPMAGGGVPIAEAVTRTGNLWTVTAGAAGEIQPAIDAAHNNGGGRVHLPARIYLLTAKVRVHSNVTVYGDGVDRTILRWAPGTPLDHMMSNATLGDGN